ncbi:hypothetical protein SAMN05421805_105327 [Saccharopolyspora antimicrobica]|uniref:Uncharacterized protein n=1 Tax=Saccharopolyspora antimicrobica TaxID=455193 RepID=A0A1I5ACP8_9PSEU|nr:hypothetical protein [Saccharopolyspora antimicrobica]RKT83195.1 hypothetical protein ATL45_1468 [Saccharopolyspora antimicrobica]SFN59989.1 hypothetical protein SAMN05421805_105327 [Saccharopolyspora antimicrobica]
MIEIEVRGRRNGTLDDGLPTVLVRLSEERTTARELIRHAVEEQVRELRADAARCRRILDRHFLSDDELRAQAAAGAIRPPRQMADPDVAEEVARAWRAFARGTFVVFVGGRQVVGLDEEITLRIGEPVVFLRLVALTGG